MASHSQIKSNKAEIVKKFGKSATNTGSPEVQVALLTHRINELNSHFKTNPKDHHSNRGLLKMVGRRKRLLAHLKRTDVKRYAGLIDSLALRK
ncbi:MAG TPA: 30S ribosomal protein S15 [Bdellovibrionota bacterium]|jgi:small subunit ribosomal protein S15|nr:30S ribosomal protein S15 [Bdellovibrionota bacterium]